MKKKSISARLVSKKMKKKNYLLYCYVCVCVCVEVNLRKTAGVGSMYSGVLKS